MRNSRVMSDQEIKAYYQNLDDLCLLNQVSVGFSLDFSNYIDSPQRLSSHARLFLHKDGRLWKETVTTVFRMVDMLMLGRHVALLGLVQSSKTATQILGVLISSTCKYLANRADYPNVERFTHPIFFIPAQKGTYIGQFKDKYEQLYECVKLVKIRCNGQEITLQEYVENAKLARNRAIAEASREAKAWCPPDQWQAYQKRKVEIEHENVVMLTMSKKNLNILPAMFGALDKANHTVIIDRDEVHSAVAEDSINDKIMKAHAAEFKLVENSIYDLIKHRAGIGRMAQFVATSATNWHSLHLEKLALCVNERYTGIDFGYYDEHGRPCQVAKSNGVTIKTPDMSSLSDFATKIGDKVLPWVRPSWYLDEELFLKWMEVEGLQRLFAGYADYRRKCAKSIAGVIIHLLVHDNWKQHKGMLVRFVNNNHQMNSFLAEIGPILSRHGIEVVREYGDEHKSIEELLEQNGIGEDKLYVIFATAGSRMSDTFPRECGYGLDLTHKSDTLAAIIQGVLGRLLGYFKDPFVILSNDNYDRIRGYIDRDFLPKHGEKLAIGIKAGSNNSYVSFMKADYQKDALVGAIFGRLQKMVDVWGKTQTKQDKTGKVKFELRLGQRVNVDFFKTIIGNSSFKYIRTLTNRKLLTPGDTDSSNRRYATNGRGQIIMTVRAEGSKKGGRPSNVQEDGTEGVMVIVRVAPLPSRGRQAVRWGVVGFDLAVHQNNQIFVDAGNTVPGRIG